MNRVQRSRGPLFKTAYRRFNDGRNHVNQMRIPQIVKEPFLDLRYPMGSSLLSRRRRLHADSTSGMQSMLSVISSASSHASHTLSASLLLDIPLRERG